MDELVGRGPELGIVRAAVDAMLAGRAGVLLIAGEPGIGKTRLADEASAVAEQRGAAACWGRCWEAGGAPAYWPWAQAIRAVAQRLGDRLPEALETAAPHLGKLDPSIAGATSHDADEHRQDPEAARFAMFDGVCTFLAEASRETPLLLVFDDLHAADIPTLVMLHFAARTLRDSRLLIVGTHRESGAGGTDEAHALLAGIGRDATTIRLGGLDLDGVARIMGSPAGEQIVERIWKLTAGNPFFVHEVSRLIASEGDLADPIRIPDGVRQTVEQRLGRLPERTRETLAHAAVIGREFGDELLASITGIARAALLEAIEPAMSAKLVAESGDRFLFEHALVRETLYASIPATERARIHRRVAEALDATAGADERIAEIAHHWLAAARLGDPGPAAAYAEQAGRRALTLLAFEDAAASFRHALDALAYDPVPDERRRCELTLALADAQWRAGRLAESRGTFLHAAELARKLDDPDLLSRAALGGGGIHAGGIWARAWTYDEALDSVVEDALARSGGGDSVVRARLLARLGGNLHFGPRREEGVAMTAEAIEIAKRLDDPETLAYCLTARHNAIWVPGSASDRLALADEMVRLSALNAGSEQRMTAHVWRQTDLLELARYAEAEAEADEYLRLARASRRPQYGAYADILESARALFRGRADDAVAFARRALEYGREGGDDNISTSAAIAWMYVELFRDANAAYELLDAHEHRENNAYLGWTAWAAAASGRHDEAKTLLASLVSDHEIRVPVDAFRLGSLQNLGRAAIETADRDAARRLLAHLLPHTDVNIIGGRNGVVRLGPVSTIAGGVAVVAGDLDRASTLLDDAIARAEASGSPTWIAQALLERGRLASAAGDRRIDASRRAIEIADRCGLHEISRAAKALSRADASTTSSPAGQPRATLVREGDVWTASLGDAVVRLRHSRGLEHLAALVAAPGREIHSLELTGGAAVQAADAGAMLDDEAKRAYRERLESARAERDEAEAFSDAERAARLDEEIDAIARELSAAVGLGGRDRRLDSAAERARIGVTKAIRTALDRIGRELPALGDHLSSSVHTGTFCRYTPSEPLDWTL